MPYWEKQPAEVGFQLSWMALHLCAAIMHIASLYYHGRRFIRGLHAQG